VEFSQTQRRRLARALLTIAAALAACGVLSAPASAETGGAGQVEQGPVLSNTPFDRQGMWIWYVSHSERGNVAAIIARAKRARIGTVYVKSGDDASTWSQFNKPLVSALHRGGLRVCAWQFVYGDHPAAEARVGVSSVRRGADCLVIDAEGAYEGKYASADRYIRNLRAGIGINFPVSLAAFPYVDYHPSFPYSVFFGIGGANYNQPQMYWRTIGTSVRAVYEHTYLYNRIWGHPIYPLGQTYESVGSGQLRMFRRFAASFGGLQPSWWSWEETKGGEWAALAANSGRQPVSGYRIDVSHPLLKQGSRGDMVVWAQEKLIAAGQEVEVTGIFGRQTKAAVRAFQEAHGITADGQLGTTTWQALMEFVPYRMNWAAAARSRPGAGASSARALPARAPLSASLPAKAYEIDPGPRP
jgi:hypothetical protein